MIKSRRMRWTGRVARTREERNAYSIVVGEPKGTRPLETPRCMWEDNIQMDLREIEWGGIDWIYKYLVQDRDRWRALVNTAMYIRVP
jgi:hypothetical protein